MIVFSTGQAEQYGYYKKVTNWSTIFDNDLAEEIANPERLALGTLDFGFVLLFLTPILLVILLFNIGGLEKDNGFDKLIYLNDISKKAWLATRFSYYFLIVFTLICFLLIPYAVLSGALTNELTNFFRLLALIFLYVFLWTSVFYLINYLGKGSVDQAIKMISVWVVLSIIMPGLFHQITSIKFSTNYMVDYLDVARDQRYEIFDMSKSPEIFRPDLPYAASFRVIVTSDAEIIIAGSKDDNGCFNLYALPKVRRKFFCTPQIVRRPRWRRSSRRPHRSPNGMDL